MAQIDRLGLYRGVIRDHGVTLTNQQQLPQFVTTLEAKELWDEVNEVWTPWEEYGQLITGYFVLVFLNKNGDVERCLNYDQIMKALGWDGASFSSLGTGDWKGRSVQFRVQPDTYDGQTKLKVVWIDSADAQIGLRKLGVKDLKSLDLHYAMSAPKPKPAGAPAPALSLKQEVDDLAVPAATAPKQPKTPPKIGVPKSSAPAIGTPAPLTTCTMEEAYAVCVATNEELGDKKVPEEVLDDYWQTRAVEIAEDTDDITPEEWAKIRDAVDADLGGLPF